MRMFLSLTLFSSLLVPLSWGRASAPELSADSYRHAIQVSRVVEQVAEQYYRPVPVERLYMAACVGLYEVAQRPVPCELLARVKSALGDQRQTTPEDDPRIRLLAEVCESTHLDLLLEPGNAVLWACKGIARELDPYSGIVTAEEQRRAVGLDYESFGVGLELREASSKGPRIVESVALGGPAQRAGLRPGDVIRQINGQTAEGATPEMVLALANERVMGGPIYLGVDEPRSGMEIPNRVEIRYQRGDSPALRTVTLQRERFRPETVVGSHRSMGNRWSYWADEKARLAYIRIANLSRGTADDMREALHRLRAQKVAGLVLDLRWCPGGYLNEAVEVADLFLGDRVIATVKMRGREDTIYRGNEASVFADTPMVVLVNGDTLGGAEMIAAALQDHHRAVVVGQRTRGKASVQTPLSVGMDGIGFKITSGTFSRPSGKNLHRSPESLPRDDWGVRPDFDCRLSPDLGRKLQNEWLLWSLRPVDSNERLVLDDPKYDAQHTEAVQVLRDQVARRARAAARK
jgi:carboxyl-terminal processing protease